MTTKGRVLIVDDDADIRTVVATALEASGFHVDAMRDGIDALDLHDQSYDAVLLDLQMPIFDGERLFDYWSLTHPALLDRVIVMTGYSHRRWQPSSKPFATVLKPFEYQSIVEVVQKCVLAHTEKES